MARPQVRADVDAANKIRDGEQASYDDVVSRRARLGYDLDLRESALCRVALARIHQRLRPDRRGRRSSRDGIFGVTSSDGNHIDPR